MGNVCNKDILKFLLPSIDKKQAPCESQSRGSGAASMRRRRAALYSAWSVSRSSSTAQPPCHGSDFSLLVFLMQKLIRSICPACVTQLLSTLEIPQQQLQLSKLESLKFKADWERSYPVNSTSWPLCGSGKH